MSSNRRNPQHPSTAGQDAPPRAGAHQNRKSMPSGSSRNLFRQSDRLSLGGRTLPKTLALSDFSLEVLPLSSEQHPITCIYAHDTALYIGTVTGSIMYYEMNYSDSPRVHQGHWSNHYDHQQCADSLSELSSETWSYRSPNTAGKHPGHGGAATKGEQGPEVDGPDDDDLDVRMSGTYGMPNSLDNRQLATSSPSPPLPSPHHQHHYLPSSADPSTPLAPPSTTRPSSPPVPVSKTHPVTHPSKPAGGAAGTSSKRNAKSSSAYPTPSTLPTPSIYKLSHKTTRVVCEHHHTASATPSMVQKTKAMGIGAISPSNPLSYDYLSDPFCALPSAIVKMVKVSEPNWLVVLCNSIICIYNATTLDYIDTVRILPTSVIKQQVANSQVQGRFISSQQYLIREGFRSGAWVELDSKLSRRGVRYASTPMDPSATTTTPTPSSRTLKQQPPVTPTITNSSSGSNPPPKKSFFRRSASSVSSPALDSTPPPSEDTPQAPHPRQFNSQSLRTSTSQHTGTSVSAMFSSATLSHRGHAQVAASKPTYMTSPPDASYPKSHSQLSGGSDVLSVSPSPASSKTSGSLLVDTTTSLLFEDTSSLHHGSSQHPLLLDELPTAGPGFIPLPAEQLCLASTTSQVISTTTESIVSIAGINQQGWEQTEPVHHHDTRSVTSTDHHLVTTTTTAMAEHNPQFDQLSLSSGDTHTQLSSSDEDDNSSLAVSGSIPSNSHGEEDREHEQFHHPLQAAGSPGVPIGAILEHPPKTPSIIVTTPGINPPAYSQLQRDMQDKRNKGRLGGVTNSTPVSPPTKSNAMEIAKTWVFAHYFHNGVLFVAFLNDKKLLIYEAHCGSNSMNMPPSSPILAQQHGQMGTTLTSALPHQDGGDNLPIMESSATQYIESIAINAGAQHRHSNSGTLQTSDDSVVCQLNTNCFSLPIQIAHPNTGQGRGADAGGEADRDNTKEEDGATSESALPQDELGNPSSQQNTINKTRQQIAFMYGEQSRNKPAVNTVVWRIHSSIVVPERYNSLLFLSSNFLSLSGRKDVWILNIATGVARMVTDLCLESFQSTLFNTSTPLSCQTASLDAGSPTPQGKSGKSSHQRESTGTGALPDSNMAGEGGSSLRLTIPSPTTNPSTQTPLSPFSYAMSPNTALFSPAGPEFTTSAEHTPFSLSMFGGASYIPSQHNTMGSLGIGSIGSLGLGIASLGSMGHSLGSLPHPSSLLGSHVTGQLGTSVTPRNASLRHASSQLADNAAPFFAGPLNNPHGSGGHTLNAYGGGGGDPSSSVALNNYLTSQQKRLAVFDRNADHTSLQFNGNVSFLMTQASDAPQFQWYNQPCILTHLETKALLEPLESAATNDGDRDAMITNSHDDADAAASAAKEQEASSSPFFSYPQITPLVARTLAEFSQSSFLLRYTISGYEPSNDWSWRPDGMLYGLPSSRIYHHTSSYTFNNLLDGDEHSGTLPVGASTPTTGLGIPTTTGDRPRQPEYSLSNHHVPGGGLPPSARSPLMASFQPSLSQGSSIPLYHPQLPPFQAPVGLYMAVNSLSNVLINKVFQDEASYIHHFTQWHYRSQHFHRARYISHLEQQRQQQQEQESGDDHDHRATSTFFAQEPTPPIFMTDSVLSPPPQQQIHLPTALAQSMVYTAIQPKSIENHIEHIRTSGPIGPTGRAAALSHMPTPDCNNNGLIPPLIFPIRDGQIAVIMGKSLFIVRFMGLDPINSASVLHNGNYASPAQVDLRLDVHHHKTTIENTYVVTGEEAMLLKNAENGSIIHPSTTTTTTGSSPTATPTPQNIGLTQTPLTIHPHIVPLTPPTLHDTTSFNILHVSAPMALPISPLRVSVMSELQLFALTNWNEMHITSHLKSNRMPPFPLPLPSSGSESERSKTGAASKTRSKGSNKDLAPGKDTPAGSSFELPPEDLSHEQQHQQQSQQSQSSSTTTRQDYGFIFPTIPPSLRMHHLNNTLSPLITSNTGVYLFCAGISDSHLLRLDCTRTQVDLPVFLPSSLPIHKRILYPCTASMPFLRDKLVLPPHTHSLPVYVHVLAANRNLGTPYDSMYQTKTASLTPSRSHHSMEQYPPSAAVDASGESHHGIDHSDSFDHVYESPFTDDALNLVEINGDKRSDHSADEFDFTVSKPGEGYVPTSSLRIPDVWDDDSESDYIEDDEHDNDPEQWREGDRNNASNPNTSTAHGGGYPMANSFGGGDHQLSAQSPLSEYQRQQNQIMAQEQRAKMRKMNRKLAQFIVIPSAHDHPPYHMDVPPSTFTQGGRGDTPFDDSIPECYKPILTIIPPQYHQQLQRIQGGHTTTGAGGGDRSPTTPGGGVGSLGQPATPSSLSMHSPRPSFQQGMSGHGSTHSSTGSLLQPEIPVNHRWSQSHRNFQKTQLKQPQTLLTVLTHAVFTYTYSLQFMEALNFTFVNPMQCTQYPLIAPSLTPAEVEDLRQSCSKDYNQVTPIQSMNAIAQTHFSYGTPSSLFPILSSNAQVYYMQPVLPTRSHPTRFLAAVSRLPQIQPNITWSQMCLHVTHHLRKLLLSGDDAYGRTMQLFSNYICFHYGYTVDCYHSLRRAGLSTSQEDAHPHPHPHPHTADAPLHDNDHSSILHRCLAIHGKIPTKREIESMIDVLVGEIELFINRLSSIISAKWSLERYPDLIRQIKVTVKDMVHYYTYPCVLPLYRLYNHHADTCLLQAYRSQSHLTPRELGATTFDLSDDELSLDEDDEDELDDNGNGNGGHSHQPQPQTQHLRNDSQPHHDGHLTHGEQPTESELTPHQQSQDISLPSPRRTRPTSATAKPASPDVGSHTSSVSIANTMTNSTTSSTNSIHAFSPIHVAKPSRIHPHALSPYELEMLTPVIETIRLAADAIVLSEFVTLLETAFSSVVTSAEKIFKWRLKKQQIFRDYRESRIQANIWRKLTSQLHSQVIQLKKRFGSPLPYCSGEDGCACGNPAVPLSISHPQRPDSTPIEPQQQQQEPSQHQPLSQIHRTKSIDSLPRLETSHRQQGVEFEQDGHRSRSNSQSSSSYHKTPPTKSDLTTTPSSSSSRSPLSTSDLSPPASFDHVDNCVADPSATPLGTLSELHSQSQSTGFDSPAKTAVPTTHSHLTPTPLTLLAEATPTLSTSGPVAHPIYSQNDTPSLHESGSKSHHISAPALGAGAGETNNLQPILSSPLPVSCTNRDQSAICTCVDVKDLCPQLQSLLRSKGPSFESLVLLMITCEESYDIPPCTCSYKDTVDTELITRLSAVNDFDHADNSTALTTRRKMRKHVNLTADDLLPLIAYCLLQAKRLTISHLDWVHRALGNDDLLGKAGFAVTSTSIALYSLSALTGSSDPVQDFPLPRKQLAASGRQPHSRGEITSSSIEPKQAVTEYEHSEYLDDDDPDVSTGSSGKSITGVFGAVLYTEIDLIDNYFSEDQRSYIHW